MREHFYEFAMWLDDRDGVAAPMVRFTTWSKWHAHHMSALRSRSVLERTLLLLGRDLLPRLVLFFACCAALEVDEFLPPEQEVVTETLSSVGSGNGSAANVTQTSETVGTAVALAKPHFRAAMVFACGCLFGLVCLPLYLLTDHRFVRRGVLPTSLWWHIGFSWAARAAAIAGHVTLCFWTFAEFLGPVGTTWGFVEAAVVNGDGAMFWYVPAMKNALIMLISGVVLQSFVAQVLGMLRRPAVGTRQPVRTQLPA